MHGDDVLFGTDVGRNLEIPSESSLYIGEPETMVDHQRQPSGRCRQTSVTSFLLGDAHDTRNVSEVSDEQMDIIDYSRYLTL
ncbi:hypothetical protein RvY_02565 [Ramazzottius varieornatus]|uniref:Uncharacterized protein n=1 Tax=Ramazzottius varieornatus TaxID=947166 RepID=A0A1D1UK53_RAMVA|nr:hypothetical protein RvY_02565 [Ramazzottius varieornatus]